MKAFGTFRLDQANHCLWRADERVPLTPKAFDVLRFLVEHSDRLVAQDELLEALWPETYVNPEGIRKYILEVRKVLGDPADKPRFIETLPKRGYQFIAPVIDDSGPPRLDTAAPPPGNIVGRAAGLAELDGYLRAALGGLRQVVFLTGEAGIGKTTLVDMFQQQVVRRPEVRFARGQCIEGFGGMEAYYPILEALGSLLRDPNHSAFVQTVARRAPTWLIQFPALMNSEQRESLQREILGSTRERMVREICEALEIITAQTPLLLILEDLHWVDPSTLDLISALARRREPAKLLLLATFRPVDVILSQSPLKALKQDLLIRRLCHEMSLERLEENHVNDYLAKMFTPGGIPPGFATLIHHNSGGNPLFMVAILQDMVNKRLIAEERGKWTLTAPVEALYPGIPETLQQMLEIQLEQLSPEEQRVLESGSVAGEHFSVWAAAAMLDASPASIEEQCDTLANRRQFIRSVGIYPAPDGRPSAHYEFRHALYRQAIYRRLQGLNRSRLHLSLGERLMPLCAGGKPELASELALHFEVGRDYERAARCLMLTAEIAARRFSYRDSIQVFRRALELASTLAPGDRSDLEIEILQRIGSAHYAVGEMSDSAASYEAAAALAANAGIKTAQVYCLVHLPEPLWYTNQERGEEVCRQALDMSGELAPLLAAQTRLTVASFRLMYDSWRPDDAALCTDARETIRKIGGATIAPDVFDVYVRAIQGDYREARKQAGTLMDTTSSPTVHVLAHGAVGLIDLCLGDFGTVLRRVRTGLASAEKNGEIPWLHVCGDAWIHLVCYDFAGVARIAAALTGSVPHVAFVNAVSGVSSGYLEIQRKNFAQALQSFAGVRDFQITPRFFMHWHWRMHAELGTAETWLAAGDIANARREADGFLRTALSVTEPNMQVLAWDIQARIARKEKDPHGAWKCIENALALIERFEIPAASWQVHRTAWDWYSGQNNQSTANQHRARSQELILKIANSFKPGEPLRESFLTAPPIRRVLGQGQSV